MIHKTSSLCHQIFVIGVLGMFQSLFYIRVWSLLSNLRDICVQNVSAYLHLMHGDVYLLTYALRGLSLSLTETHTQLILLHKWQLSRLLELVFCLVWCSKENNVVLGFNLSIMSWIIFHGYSYVTSYLFVLLIILPWFLNMCLKLGWYLITVLDLVILSGSITRTMTRNTGPYTNLLRLWTGWEWI